MLGFDCMAILQGFHIEMIAFFSMNWLSYYCMLSYNLKSKNICEICEYVNEAIEVGLAT